MQYKLIILMKNNKDTNVKLSKLLGITDKQFAEKLKGNSDFKSKEMFILSNYYNLPIEAIFLPSLYQNGTLGKEKKEE